MKLTNDKFKNINKLLDKIINDEKFIRRQLEKLLKEEKTDIREQIKKSAADIKYGADSILKKL